METKHLPRGTEVINPAKELCAIVEYEPGGMVEIRGPGGRTDLWWPSQLKLATAGQTVG